MSIDNTFLVKKIGALAGSEKMQENVSALKIQLDVAKKAAVLLDFLSATRISSADRMSSLQMRQQINLMVIQNYKTKVMPLIYS